MTDGADGEGEFLFLYGADMDPSAVRAAFPDARFVARAWVAGGDLPRRLSSGSDWDEVWGILIRAPLGAPAPGSVPVAATSDDGRGVTAHPMTGQAALVDAAATLAAARYWELPPPYVATLAAGMGSE